MLCAAVLAVQTFSAGDVCAATYTDDAANARKDLKRRPSFRALEQFRADRQSSSAASMGPTKYYKDTNETGMTEYRPDVHMGDITQAGESSQKLVSEMLQSQQHLATSNSLAQNQQEEDKIISALKDLQRAVGDVQSLPSGQGTAYERYVDGGMVKYRPMANHLTVDTDNPDSVIHALRSLIDKAAKKNQQLDRISDILKEKLSPENYSNYVSANISTNIIDSAVAAALDLARQEGRQEARQEAMNAAANPAGGAQ